MFQSKEINTIRKNIFEYLTQPYLVLQSRIFENGSVESLVLALVFILSNIF